MALDPEIAPAVSAALMRLCARNAFFGALALFARFQSSEQVPTAATDGRDVFINTSFFAPLTSAEQEAVLLHEVLHAALLHVPRRGGRDPQLWNVAADFVVNGMLGREGYQLPAGALRDAAREHLSAEEIYELLLREHQAVPAAPWADLLSEAPDDAGGASDDAGGASDDDQRPPADRRAALESYWGQARQQAQLVAEMTHHGTLPAGLSRELRPIQPGRLDWRSLLWRHIVRSPIDFQGFDRRFVGQGLYLDALDGETLHVAVAVDTSGSIDQGALRVFLSEVRGILRTYPHLRCDLYYADAALHGPYPLTVHGPTPPPIGGGGTDFRPFFERVGARGGRHRAAVAVYLTDGYGNFPDSPPPCPVLWVVTPGGLDLDNFPFGQAVRLLPHDQAVASPA
jgi:predicted metal-dependent peptidase